MQLTAPAGDDIRLIHWVGRAFPTLPAKIGIAVSGGGDSMALLHLFARWSAQTGHPIAAVTVDHGLRDGSAREAAQVAAFCKDAGISHDILHWTDWDSHGNLQAAARDARYRLMADWARDAGVGGIALGHTMDDGAETFLMRLSRKAGVDGLSAMDRIFDRSGMTYARPLWMCSRKELRDYLTRNHIEWVDDPSNYDLDFERIRVRQAMDALGQLGLKADALTHAAAALRQSRDALAYYTAHEAQTHVAVQAGDLILPLKPDVPDEIARRLRSKVIQWMGHLPYPPRQSAMQHLMDGVAIEGTHTLGGAIVTHTDGQLRIAREMNAVRQVTCQTDQIWDRRWALDGPHSDELHVAALGNGIVDCPDWRAQELPRQSLLASPAIWHNDTLIAAPIAGLHRGWNARIVADFHSSLVAH
jgi:tRNA(Ile)-lysidine synthase